MKSFPLLFRDHLHFLIIVPLLIIVTTWTLAQNILDLNTVHLPPGQGDVFIELWDSWYSRLLLKGDADYYFTNFSFHPRGLSLAYHHLGIPHLLVFGALQALLPTTNAFFLTYLISVFFNACAGYFFLLYFLRDKWIALAGALIFALSPYFLPHISHPDHTIIATIPLALYALHRGITEHSRAWLFAAGAIAGFTAFIMMYIFACLFITMGVYTIYLALTRWRDKRFWRRVALTLLVAATIGIIRVYPMIADLNLLNVALAKNLGSSGSTDLLVFFVNPRHPLVQAGLKTLSASPPLPVPPDGYLGILPLALTLIGLRRPSSRRLMAPWLAMALIFMILRLGAELQIGGHVFSGLFLPKHYLDTIVPWLTKAFWDRAFFQIGILLPLAALSCYGLQTALASVPPRRRPLIIVPLAILIAVEYHQPPPTGNPDYRESYPWIDWLAAEPDQDAIHLINLPMGRHHSKLYLYHQTLHGYPQVEGLAARTPEVAYDYIEANPLLSAWRADKTLYCLPYNRDNVIAAQQQLIADGFTHIILHPEPITTDELAANFYNLPPAYIDELVAIYRVNELHNICHEAENIALLVSGDRYINQNMTAAAPLPANAIAVLSLHPADQNAEQLETLSATTVIAADQAHLLFHKARPPANELVPINQHRELTRARESKDAILFVYHPRASNEDLVETYRAWLASSFTNCGRVADSETAVIEYFLRPGFPCQLALDDAPLAVEYDNGVQLGNLLASLNEDKLNLHLSWKRLPSETHATSFQFFDAAGAKIHNQDFVFHHDALGRYEVDLSNLPPGTYSAKLIVYNYDAGASLPGLLLSSQTRFNRELEFMRFHIAQ